MLSFSCCVYDTFESSWKIQYPVYSYRCRSIIQLNVLLFFPQVNLPADHAGCASSYRDQRQHCQHLQCQWNTIGEFSDFNSMKANHSSVIKFSLHPSLFLTPLKERWAMESCRKPLNLPIKSDFYSSYKVH